MPEPILHLMAGKIASGKSTLASPWHPIVRPFCSVKIIGSHSSTLIRSNQCSITYGFRGCWSSPLFPLHRTG